MRRSALVAWLFSFAIGCGSGPEAPHGSPILTQVFWLAGGVRTQIYGGDPDAAPTAAVPGSLSELDFVFDRRLDGNRIETEVGGVAVPNAEPAVTATWPDMDTVMSDPPFAADVLYNSVPLFGGESAYVFLRPHDLGLPSGTTVTFHLDKTKLTSAYGDPMTGPDAIQVEIAPLAVLPGSPSSSDALSIRASDFALRVVFNDRPAAPPALTPFARVTAGGVPVPFSIGADSSDRRAIFIRPGGCDRRWPAGAVVDVRFDPGLPDAFGVPTTGSLEGGSFAVVDQSSGDATPGADATADAGVDAAPACSSADAAVD